MTFLKALILNWFLGFTLFTLGMGDISARGGVLQIVTILCASSGFLLVVIVASYVISTMSVVAAAQTFASTVESLGGDPVVILVNSWSPEKLRFSPALNSILSDLTSEILSLREQTFSFPLVFHFDLGQPPQSSAISSFATLDKLSKIVRFGIETPSEPIVDHITIHSLERALELIADTIVSEYGLALLPIGCEEILDLSLLKACGVPVVSETLALVRNGLMVDHDRKMDSLRRAREE